MSRQALRGRLELTWMGKDQALIPSERGGYDYQWVDKSDPRACQTHYLIEEGHHGDITDGGSHDNLLITGESGDVLEALTRVPELADKYAGRVKCVYIDPPFNTEKTFTHYEDNLEHSVWLTLMRDRLVLIKKLLAADGTIWVHLDDSENHRMRLLMDEVFGPGNFIAEFVWQKVYAPENRSKLSRDQDFITVYGVDRPQAMNSLNAMPRSAAQDIAYKNLDNDPRGRWKAADASAKAEVGRRAEQFYSITLPSGKVVNPPEGRCWLYTEPRFQEMVADNRIWFGADGFSRPAIKRFLSEVKQTRTPSTWWPHQEVGHNQDGKKEIKNLFPDLVPFTTPKPESLIQRVLQIATNPGDLVLDCFAGSGTTAAVAHKMGRRWVTCELLPETMDVFIRPRLEKVVSGEDQGGVSIISERVAVDDLPEGFTPEEAQELTRLLGKFTKVSAAFDANSVKAARAELRTRSEDTQQWSGGGGFDIAKLSPVWVAVEEDPRTGITATFTTPEATGEVLCRSVAAQLGFYQCPEAPRFAGVKGRQWLVVVEGMFTEALLDEYVAALPDGAALTVVCDGAAAGIDKHLRQRARGSRLLVMPDDLFSFNRKVS